MSWTTWVNISCFQLSLLLRCFEINGKKRPSTCCRWDDGTQKWECLSWMIMKSRQLAKHQECQERYIYIRQIQHHAKCKTCAYDTFKTCWIFLDLAWCFRYGGIYSTRFLLKSLHHEAPASASKEMSETRTQEANNDIFRWTNYRCNIATWKFMSHVTKTSSGLLWFSWMMSEFVKDCFWMVLVCVCVCFSSQLPRVQSI